MAREQIQHRTPKIEIARKREREAFDLRLTGLPFTEIAKQVGYRSPSSAWKAVKRHLKYLGPGPEAEEMRQVQVARMVELLRAVWPYAVNDPPDMDAQTRALALIKEIASMLGLYLPKQVVAKVDITHRTDPLENVNIEDLVSLIRWLETFSPEDRGFLASVGREVGSNPTDSSH